MKVLMSFVGKQDPISDKTDAEGSIVTLVRYLKPDAVYLFPTARGMKVRSDTETEAVNTEAWIRDEIGGEISIFIRPVRLGDPTDYISVIPAVRREISAVLDELAEYGAEIHMNCSSGTPQMKGVWLILANAGAIPNSRLWQVANPSYSEGERVSEIEATLLEEENILHRIERNVSQSIFLKIAEECRRLEEISIYSYRKDKAGIAKQIFTAFHHWDLIQYDEAYKQLSGINNRIRRARDLADVVSVLDQQVNFLLRLQEGSPLENRYNLVDLYFNAQRRYKRHEYTDTLARFWRIYEGTLFKYLRDKYGIEATDLHKSANQGSLEIIHNYRRNSYSKEIGDRKLSLHGAGTVLLEVFKDQRFIDLENAEIDAVQDGKRSRVKAFVLIEKLRKKRNNSIIAHGMEPVRREDADNCVEIMRLVLRYMLPSFKEVEQKYPLRGDMVNTVLSSLKKAFSH